MLSTLLNELDGIQGRRGVYVVGTTRAPSYVDAALLRPGRFDEVLAVPPPDAETSLALLRRACGLDEPQGAPRVDPQLDLPALAQRLTSDMTCAQVVTMGREALRNAFRRLALAPRRSPVLESSSEAPIYAPDVLELRAVDFQRPPA